MSNGDVIRLAIVAHSNGTRPRRDHVPQLLSDCMSEADDWERKLELQGTHSGQMQATAELQRSYA